MSKVAEHTQPVINGNNHGAATRELAAFIRALRARAGRVAAAMKPYQHRQACANCRVRSPDVQRQAVFASTIKVVSRPSDRSLRADWSKSRSLSEVQPSPCRRWWPPTELADRGRSVWDCLERRNTFVRGSGYPALCDGRVFIDLLSAQIATNVVDYGMLPSVPTSCRLSILSGGRDSDLSPTFLTGKTHTLPFIAAFWLPNGGHCSCRYDRVAAFAATARKSENDNKFSSFVELTRPPGQRAGGDNGLG
jgi:hypothetical protein